MGIEIERKFLVDRAAWEKADKPAGKIFKQGYILGEDNRTVRIRVTDEAAYLTLKGSLTGISRSEYEYTIPIADGEEIMRDFTISRIEKTRYFINHGGQVWEVDVFSGNNEGLIIAELELNSEDEQFEKPVWALTEVTNDHRYANSQLAVAPYKDWGNVSI